MSGLPDRPHGSRPPRADRVRAAWGRRNGWTSALHPVLLAAYPVLFLWSQNVGEVGLLEVLVPLLITTSGAALLTLALGLLLRDIRRAALIVSPLVIWLLAYGHATRVGRHFDIPVPLQWAAWLALGVVAVVAAVRLSGPHIQRVGGILTRVAAILIAVTLVLIVPFQVAGIRAGSDASSDDPVFATTTDAPMRDVYWLIFDRYGSDRSFDLLYGLDNDLTPWLRDQGFTVLDGAHPNYVRTILSIASTSQMTHVADMPGLPGPDETSQAYLSDAIKRSAVAGQFKALGYRYLNIGSWWGPTRSSPQADVNLHTPGPDEFSSALIETSAAPAVLRHLGYGPLDVRTRHWENNQYGLDALASVRDEPGPKFVLAHILLPHPPYVHHPDGSFVTVADKQGKTVKDVLADQLAYTNSRLRAILGDLLAVPEERRPIIILQADEGAETPAYRATRLTTWDWDEATTRDFEIKFGILNAWYVPGDRPVDLYPGVTSINTFPLLFRDYFGLDYETLPDRIYALDTYREVYDLVDVTDRLPPP